MFKDEQSLSAAPSLLASLTYRRCYLFYCFPEVFIKTLSFKVSMLRDATSPRERNDPLGPTQIVRLSVENAANGRYVEQKQQNVNEQQQETVSVGSKNKQ